MHFFLAQATTAVTTTTTGAAAVPPPPASVGFFETPWGIALLVGGVLVIIIALYLRKRQADGM